MFKELDPLLHSQLRLAVMSILLSAEEADFVYLKEKNAGGPPGRTMSVQIDKLSEAGYIEVEKASSGKSPARLAGSRLPASRRSRIMWMR